MPQITTYLTPAEHAEFSAYAGEFGLDVGALAHLLFHRELRLGRVATLASRFSSHGGTASMKVTAHTADARLKARLQSHARSFDLSLSRACALLVRAELDERWLNRVVNHTDSE